MVCFVKIAEKKLQFFDSFVKKGEGRFKTTRAGKKCPFDI
jgi:hypothetical protein